MSQPLPFQAGWFGLGLYVSQMVDPLKVLRFLDIGAIPSDGWDPSLAFVIVRRSW